VIVTDHDNIDYAMLLRFSKLVLDTRNALAAIALPDYAHIVARA